MVDTENVDEFMIGFMGIVNQIKLIGGTIANHKIVEKVLQNLSKKFEMVVRTIMKLKFLNKLSINHLIKSLLSHETQLKLEEGSVEQDFKAQVSLNKGTSRGSRGRSK